MELRNRDDSPTGKQSYMETAFLSPSRTLCPLAVSHHSTTPPSQPPIYLLSEFAFSGWLVKMAGCSLRALVSDAFHLTQTFEAHPCIGACHHRLVFVGV